MTEQQPTVTAGDRRRRRPVAGGAVVAALAALVVGADAGPATAGGGPGGTATCGSVRFDRSALPGRPVDPARHDLPTARAADLVGLHGWPRAVPYAVARWTAVLAGDRGVLVAAVPGRPPRYLPVTRDPGGPWVAGPPCVPR